MANDNPDQELLQIFLEESTDLIASLSATLRSWENDLNNLNKIADLKRDLHTLKGSARMVGQMVIGTLAHELETLCEAIARGQVKINRDLFQLINLGGDRIALMVEALKNNTPLPSGEDLIQQFHKVLPPGTETAPAPASAPTSTPTATPASQAAQPVTPPPAPAPVEVAKETEKKKETTEIIRIRSDLLEKLTDLSTENSMVRISLEQQIENFRSNLQEIKNTMRHLDTQIGTLSSEIETHSNIEKFQMLEQINNSIRETRYDLMNALKGLQESTSTAESLLMNQSRINTELQLRLSGTRLVPFESIVPRLSRIARQVSTELKKAVDFKVTKSQGEMDRTVLEHLIPSLEHILRNALDHGIESPDIRKQRGKPEVGKIEVSFERSGSTVAIIVSDDGGGIDVNVIKKKAIKIGMLSPNTEISDEEAIRFIMAPGFSTREAVSEISGRGVGMDVVNMAVKEMGGTLDIDTKIGVGTKFIIRFPFTISLNRVMLFTIETEIYGILLGNIEGIENISFSQLNDATFKHGEMSYHLHYLGQLLNIENVDVHIPKKESYPVILFSATNYPVALIVDSILYNRELIVQALSTQFKLNNLCSGATMLGDGKVVFILDPYALSTKAKNMSTREVTPLTFKPVAKRKPGSITIMIVDDSLSVRTVTKRMLERNKYNVTLAKDGIEALEKLEIETPDLILLDIDMPRMDGFEFVSQIQNDDRFKNIPIIIITSRPLEHKKRATALNLHHILGKPYHESDLMANIHTLIQKEVL